jgi:hypothetical protein
MPSEEPYVTRFLAEDPSDPNGLDADNDGEACEVDYGGGSTAPSTATGESDDEESATSTAIAEADDEESAMATASAASAAGGILPPTGGPTSSFMLGVLPLMLIVGGGILSALVICRSS